MGRLKKERRAARRQCAASVPQPHWHIPPNIQRQGARLLHQQCWCWGCDIRHAAGNLLLTYGCTRQRPPVDVQDGNSVYTFTCADNRVIVLWGFGVFSGDTAVGGLYLKRAGFKPRLTPTANPPLMVWHETQLPALRNPQTDTDIQVACRLLTGLCRWISDYEQWVITTCGLEYRQQCLATWRQIACEPDQVVGAWQHLATWSKSEMIQTERCNA